jgi:hypothetical protein
VLLQPEAARTIHLPTPDDRTPEGAALAALVEACRSAGGPLGTAGLMQQFAGTAHESVLATALATAEANAITPELAGEHLQAGIRRFWLQAQRAGHAGPGEASADAPAGAGAASELPAEETERLRQLDLVRRALPGSAPPSDRRP